MTAQAGLVDVGLAAGRACAPTPIVHSEHEESPMSFKTLTPTSHAGHGARAASMADYRIYAPATRLASGEPRRFDFEVLDPAGATVTDFEDRHDRLMHLIVVSNDLADYAHLHPQLADDGTWSVEFPGLVAGRHRVVADTVPADGPDLVLTVDLFVPGVATARPLPDPADTVVVDDLAVSIALTPTADGLTVALTVRRDGATVEPDPYLGARGHLVAINADDLGYLHVHPDDGDGPVSFATARPAPGRYRLFFDFSVGGQVRTAAFTVDVPSDPAATPGDGHVHTGGGSHR